MTQLTDGPNAVDSTHARTILARITGVGLLARRGGAAVDAGVDAEGGWR